MIVTVKQEPKSVEIRIMHDDDGYLAAKAEYDHTKPLWPVKYTIINSIHIPPTLTEASSAGYSNLFAFATQALKSLKKNVTSPADFKRKWSARLTRKSIVIEEVEAVANERA